MRDRGESRNVAGALSPERRARDLERLRDEEFDVLVIGGGVTGAGTALDAASRGLSVALIEATDLASGTSSRSSKLVHGGLRYLEQLEFHLVHEALKERGLLATRLAPHLVRPIPFLVPLPGDTWAKRTWNRVYYGAGVALYDVFASATGHGRGMPVHRHLTQRSARQLFPSLRAEAAAGAIRYYDGQVDDARLVVSLARTAASLGACVVTGAKAVGLIRDAREVKGVRLSVADFSAERSEAPEIGRRGTDSEEFVVRAHTVIAATGVWSDDITALLPDARPGLRVRASKGIHIVVPRAAITGDVGLILRTAKSVLFVIPWGGHWIIGTTDTDWTLGRDHPAATSADIDYLLEEVNSVLERPLRVSDIEGVYAGLRPLLSGEQESTSALSREHAVVEPMLGLFLVAGGKLTTYRVMAADVVDRAAHRLGTRAHSHTDQLPLLGADGFESLWLQRSDLARRHGVALGVVEHLLERFGSLSLDILKLVDDDPTLRHPIAGAPEYIAAEAVYAASTEGVRHLDDVLSRRTRISFETAHRGAESARHVAELIAGVLGWSAARVEDEVASYLAKVASERESQLMPDDLAADSVLFK